MKLPAIIASVALLLPFGPVSAQAHHESTLSLAAARQALAAASRMASDSGWRVTIAVVDDHGELMALERGDGARLVTLEIAQAKARTAARFGRPTRALQESVAGGNVGIATVPGAIILEGGVPIIRDGRILGAVGVSGVTSAQDAAAATAGVEAALR